MASVLMSDFAKTGGMLSGEVNAELSSSFKYIQQQQNTLTQSYNTFREVVQKIAILNKIRELTGQPFIQRSASQFMKNYTGDESINPASEAMITTKIAYMGGIIDNKSVHQLKRLVIRTTRCQVFVHSFPLNLEEQDQLIEDKDQEQKSIYVMVYQEGSILEDKIKRICNSFSDISHSVTLEELNDEHNAAH